MKSIMQNLLQLQSVEFSETKNAGGKAVLVEIRSQIPAQILGHYDRLVARGKKGVVMVRHQTCAACHMNIPVGAMLTLTRGDDVVLCENCGRYLCLDEPAQAAPVADKKPSCKKSKLPASS